MGKKRRQRTSWLFAAKITGNFPFDFHFMWDERTNRIQCSYCGKFFGAEDITRDHVYPKSLEGTYTTPCCNPCNIAKENKLPIEWAVFATESEIAFGKEWISKSRIKKELEEQLTAVVSMDKHDSLPNCGSEFESPSQYQLQERGVTVA